MHAANEVVIIVPCLQIDTVCETRDKAHADTLFQQLQHTYGHRLVSWGGKPISSKNTK